MALIFSLKISCILLCLPVTLLLAQSDSEEGNKPARLSPVVPKMPKMPNCGDSSPGSPQWNECWDNFRNHMNVYQKKMQKFGHDLEIQAQRNSKPPFRQHSHSHGFSGFGRQNSHGFSGFGSSMSSSSSMVSTNGYTIHASGLPISTSTHDGKIQIKFPLQSHEKLESRLERDEIEIRVKTFNGGTKWARVRVPSSIQPSFVKFDRTPEAITITGPTPKNYGSGMMNPMSVFQSQSSNFFSPFPSIQQFPSMSMMSMPNQNIYAVKQPAVAGIASASAKPPQMWFF